MATFLPVHLFLYSETHNQYKFDFICKSIVFINSAICKVIPQIVLGLFLDEDIEWVLITWIYIFRQLKISDLTFAKISMQYSISFWLKNIM